VKLVAVEFDDQPLGGEERVDLVAGYGRVDQWGGEVKAAGEGEECVLDSERVGPVGASMNGLSRLAPG
jgi:hypothetical protein